MQIVLLLFIELADTFVVPAVLATGAGTCAWIFYTQRIQQQQPWGDSPVLLSEDELDIARDYMVGSIQDAAFILGMTRTEVKPIHAPHYVLCSWVVFTR